VLIVDPTCLSMSDLFLSRTPVPTAVHYQMTIIVSQILVRSTIAKTSTTLSITPLIDAVIITVRRQHCSNGFKTHNAHALTKRDARTEGSNNQKIIDFYSFFGLSSYLCSISMVLLSANPTFVGLAANYRNVTVTCVTRSQPLANKPRTRP
jgi:hypothetical protein